MKFNSLPHAFRLRKCIMLNVMRLIILLFFGTTFAFAPLNGLSQEKIHFKTDETLTLDAIFERIEVETDYHFIYRSDLFKEAPEININQGKIKVNKLLERSLRSMPFDFEISGNSIVLVPKLIPSNSNTQQQEITGTVTDGDGVPLSGVNITIDGTSRGTQTDFDGNYTIKAEKGETLHFSFVGFAEQDVTVGGDITVNVQMEESQSALDEVVVVGYGTQKAMDNTSAVSSVSGDEIAKKSISTNINNALQGKIPGVQISGTDRPGSSPTVVIRGLGTVLGGRKPLYVVDGMFVDNIDFLNARDIESFNVLKDASALAIYGNRAANGAIIIQTKMGKNRLKIEYSGSTGFKRLASKVHMANTEEYVRYTNIIEGGILSENQPYDVDWIDQITRTGLYNQHNLMISGSSEKVRYLFSMNNYNEKGVQEATNFNRTTLRSNNIFLLSDNIKLTQMAGASLSDNSPRSLDVFLNALEYPPILPSRYEDGRFSGTLVNDNGIPDPEGNFDFLNEQNVMNPLLRNEISRNKTKGLQLVGGIKLDIDLEFIVEGLTFTSQYNGEYKNSKGYNFDNGMRQVGRPFPGFINELTTTREDYFNWVNSNFFNFDTELGSSHHIEATLGMELSNESGIDNITAIKEDMSPELQQYWKLSGKNYAGDTRELYELNGNNRRTLSYFGRVQYSLVNKYLISGTLRRDGSSQFSKDNRWGTFPSVGVAWIISREDFLKDSKIIENLKLRGGWGRLGNQNVPLNIPTFATGTQYSYSFDSNHVSDGVTADQEFDPNLTWEVTEEMSVGMDFDLLDRKLSGSVNYYNKETKNLILQSLPIMTKGVGIAGYSHLGSVTNKGIELSLNWKDQVGSDFNYSIGLSYAHNKNSLDKVGDDVDIIEGGQLMPNGFSKYFAKKTEGQPLGSFYLYEHEGFDNQGDLLFKDLNGNGVTGRADPNDRKFFGSYIPVDNLGISLEASYKNWDISIDGQGAFGQKIFDGKYYSRQGGENMERRVATDFWTPENTDAKHPSPLFAQVGTPSNYALHSGDYFRIKNITLGYTIETPVKFINLLRIYVSAENSLTFMKYKRFSTEIIGDGDPYGSAGIQQSIYPDLSTYTLGLNLNF